MELVIITGLSGAGKTKTLQAFEDHGFMCCDNVPPLLLYDTVRTFETVTQKIAIVCDLRCGKLFLQWNDSLKTLKSKGYQYKILYLECETYQLVSRYKELRRVHPFSDQFTQIESAVSAESELLKSAKKRADFLIDTTKLTLAQLKETITQICMSFTRPITIRLVSFGVKYGSCMDADLLFDVRCFPNPYYIEELKRKTGLDRFVQEYVMRFPESQQLLDKLLDLLTFMIPLYQKEGKSLLTVGICCTGGKHRSVAFAAKLSEKLREAGFPCFAIHRDVDKKE